MSKHRVIVLKIVAKQSPVSQASAEYGLSRMHLYRLLARFREGGLDALAPKDLARQGRIRTRRRGRSRPGSSSCVAG